MASHHNSSRMIFLFLFFFLMLPSCSDDEKVFTPLTPGATILAFGDSLTHGNGATQQQAYPAILSLLSGHPVINAGVSGEVSSAGLRRLPALLEQYQPALVIICHGGNDLLRKQNLNQTRANLAQMIYLARQHQAQVLLLAVPKPSLSLRPPDFYRQVADETSAVINMELLPEVLGDRNLKSDTYHPNAAGYRVMAKTIYRQLQSGGALP